MRTLLFIALMLCFLIGNAQQARQQFRPTTNTDRIQLTNGIKPGYTSEIERYRNIIMETENLGHPSRSDIYEKRIMKTDMHPGYPSESEPNKNKIMKPDKNYNPGFDKEVDKYEKKIMKTN